MESDRSGLAASEPGAETHSSPGTATGHSQGLFNKLVWLTLFRLVMVTVLLGVSAFTAWRTQIAADETIARLYLVIGATYVVSLGFVLMLRVRLWLQGVAYGQIVLDIGIASAVVSMTGYSESVFLFLFLLGIVNASILLFQRGAVVSALLALGSYLFVALALDPRAEPVLPLTLFVHASAFALTAALASYLAAQLQHTGKKLEARESDFAALTALHEAIVQSVEAGLLTIDESGRVSFLNKAGAQMTGLSLAEIRGQPAIQWFSAFQSRSRRDETDFTNARGEKLRLGYDIFPLVTPKGEQIGRAVIFQDLTRLRAMEVAMQRSARLADLGRMAAGLAHELRNPLASMSGSIELLGAGAPMPAEDERLMEIVVREAARLNQLVTRFLDFARPVPLRREPVDLALVLADTLDVFAHSPSSSEVTLERQMEPTPVVCDADQLRQIFWNLLVNANQAISAKGENAQGRIEVGCSPAPDGGAVIRIADNGTGISAADLARIFTPFFSTKEQGTGLGLAIVERIVDAHGGVISVDSLPGQGTTLTILLPRDGSPSNAGLQPAG